MFTKIADIAIYAARREQGYAKLLQLTSDACRLSKSLTANYSWS